MNYSGPAFLPPYDLAPPPPPPPLKQVVSLSRSSSVSSVKPTHGDRGEEGVGEDLSHMMARKLGPL